MNKYFEVNAFRFSYVLILLSPVLLLFAAFLISAGNDDLNRGVFFDTQILPSLKSILYAFYVAAFSTLLATLIGFSIYQCEKKYKLSLHWFVSLLVLPFLLGSSSAAYLQKIILANSGIFEMAVHGGWLSMHFLGGLGAVWQYGSLGAYLCYLALTQLNMREVEYVHINKLPDRNFYFDFYISRVTSLSIILFLLFYLFSFYEYTKLHLLYKPSVAAGTELAAHSLSRVYKSVSIYDPLAANVHIFNSSLFLMVVVIISLLLSINVWAKSIDAGRNIIMSGFDRGSPSRQTKDRVYLSICIFAGVFFIYPVIYGFTNSIYQFNLDSISPLTNAIGPVIPVALVLTLAASMCAMIARMHWPNYTSRVNSKFAVFIALSCIAIAVPPIAVAITVLYYKGFLPPVASQNYYVWGSGMLLAYLPLITVFFLASYLSISKEELNYAKVHKLHLINIVKDIFGLRFLAIYLLTFLLSISIILNDHTINNMFSDFVISLSGVFDRSLIGRSENETLAASLLLLSSALAFSILFIWTLARRSMMGLRG